MLGPMWRVESGHAHRTLKAESCPFCLCCRLPSRVDSCCHLFDAEGEEEGLSPGNSAGFLLFKQTFAHAVRLF